MNNAIKTYSRFDRDFAYKFLTPKFFFEPANQKVIAIVSFWKGNKNRLSLLRCFYFLNLFFNTQGGGKLRIKIITSNKKEKKFRRFFLIDMSNCDIFLENLYSFPIITTKGMSYGHDIFFEFPSFKIRVPIYFEKPAYLYKIYPYIQLQLDKKEENQVINNG